MERVLTGTKRTYRIVICEPSAGVSLTEITASELLLENPSKTEAEYVYAMREIIDEVMDLKARESMYFQPNRDDDSTRGIILRTE